MISLPGLPSGLRILFAIHAVLTFAASVVLVLEPTAIPSAAGIHVEPSAYLLCYLLAAAELGISVLSWGARTITDIKALRLIVVSFMIFHAASGALEIYAFAGSTNAVIWANVVVRIFVIGLFAYFGRKVLAASKWAASSRTMNK
jgi:hypothetical protein